MALDLQFDYESDRDLGGQLSFAHFVRAADIIDALDSKLDGITAFSTAAGVIDDELLPLVNVTLQKLNLEVLAPVDKALPEVVLAWLHEVDQSVQVMVGKEARARLSIDPIAILSVAAARDTNVKLAVEPNVKLELLQPDNFLQGPLDYSFVCNDQPIGIIEAKSIKQFDAPASLRQLYLQLLAMMYGDIEDQGNSLKVKCMWGFLSDGARYRLGILDHFHRFFVVDGLNRSQAYFILVHLLCNKDYFTNLLSNALLMQLQGLGIDDEELRNAGATI